MSELPGVDLAALTRWLDDHQPGLRAGELSGEVLAGGKSNLTYRITDGTQQWALRRPPLAHVLPTAHDMAREYRVTSALAGSAVPVADPIVLCDDPDVLGAPFYLMAYVDGVVLDKRRALDGLTEADAARASDLLIDTLLALHAVVPAEVGLAEFGRPDGFLARQLRRWYQQWQASETRPLDVLGKVIDGLSESLPSQSPPGIVHGDYRMTNVMFAADFTRIAAVVDWEMATIGDPLTDVGLLVVYQSLAQQGDSTVMPQMPADRGFATAEAMIERYRADSSRDLDDLGWYVAFGYFKLAVIGEGIHHRYLEGKTVGEGFDHFGRFVPQLLDTALTSLEESYGLSAR